jgi:hypothetical protein
MIMTTTLTVENPVNLSKVQIPHLGPARRKNLKEWFDVDTVQGLAALSADDVEAKFKPKGVSRKKIEGWIALAQQLATAPVLTSQHVAELANAEAEEKTNSSAAEGEWKPFAAFWVEFQGREMEGRPEERRIAVSHVPVEHGAWLEDKRTEPIVMEGEQLYQWMQNQADERMPQVPEPPEEEPPLEARPAAASPVTVEITQIQAFQPPEAETPIGIGKADRPFQGFIRSDKPFTLKASFELTGPGAADVAKRQATYNAKYHVLNLTTRAKTHLGDTNPIRLVEGRPSYTATLPEVSLPPGMYRLRVLATLRGDPPISGYLEVPVLQVA